MPEINSKTYVLLTAVFIVGILLGYLVGSGAKNQAYQLGLEMGRAEVEQEYQKKIEAAFPSMPEPAEVYSITGKITNIEGQTLTLKVTLPVSSPLEEPRTEIKTVQVTNATTFVKQMTKSPEEFMAEEEAFAAGEREAPPSLYNEEAIDFSELKIGDTITAESGENIKGKTSFEAEKVVLIPEF